MKPNGGLAFPVSGVPLDENGKAEVKPHHGMTLRDYFAAKVMQGILASCPEGMSRNSLSPELLAGWASVSYRISDAMLAEREK